MKRALVVEDDPDIVELIDHYLKAEGYQVEAVGDGRQALERLRAGSHDVVILDLQLPGMDGLSLCAELRRDERTHALPVIMLTARGDEADRVVGLEVGADDYVTKPYRLRELVARMRAVLRRTPISEPSTLSGESMTVGDVTIDPEGHEVVVRGESVSLPLKEFELLALLIENAGRVLPRETLIDRVWGLDYVGDTKTLDVHIKRLRSKVEADPSEPTRIVTIRGLGYKYEMPKG